MNEGGDASERLIVPTAKARPSGAPVAARNVGVRLLTLRERAILPKILSGLCNKEVAAELGVCANTVAVHIRNIYKKLNVHSRKEALAYFESGHRAELSASITAAQHVRYSRKGGARQYVLALDQGTIRSCAIVFDWRGRVVASAQKEVAQSHPCSGWVETDGLAIWSTQAGVAAEVLASAGLDESQIAGIGIANQRATTVVWDRETGKPVCPAILWQDRRTADVCEQLKRDGRADWIRRKTGLVPDPYFSAPKLGWILDHVKGARKRAEAGRLLFGTVDAWLLWNSTCGEVHATDASNASHTMLYNIHTGTWDRELLELFGVPEQMLPQLRPSSEIYGVTRTPFLPVGVPLASRVGDQQAAMFGQRCIAPGMVKCTYGAGCFLAMNTGDQPILSANNMLTTVAWDIGGRRTFALEGNIFVAGDVVEWLRDGLGVIRKTADVEALAASVPDSGGLFFVPAFDGLGAPHWNFRARGTLLGLTRESTAGHIARAALEGIAYQTRDVLKAMEADSKIPVSELRVDGEHTANNLLMQFQSDILGVPVSRPKASETRALGAAYLAGLAVGYWTGPSEISAQWQEARRFEPAQLQEKVRRLTMGWVRALKAAAAWDDA